MAVKPVFDPLIRVRVEGSRSSVCLTPKQAAALVGELADALQSFYETQVNRPLVMKSKIAEIFIEIEV